MSRPSTRLSHCDDRPQSLAVCAAHAEDFVRLCLAGGLLLISLLLMEPIAPGTT